MILLCLHTWILMKRRVFTSFAMALVLLSVRAQAQSSTPREQLQQYVLELQKNPADNELREKIIKLSQQLKPLPEIPEEARQHFVKAVTLQKESKDSKGLDLALSEYRQALLVAPWWPEAYYNFSVALEQTSHFDDALAALKLYLLSDVNATEAREAKDKIYAIEAKRDLAAQTAAAEAEAARRKQQEERNRPPDFSGKWVIEGHERYVPRTRFEVSGTRVTIVDFEPPGPCKKIFGTGTVDGRHFSGVLYEGDYEGNSYIVPRCGHTSNYLGDFTGSISDDDSRIEVNVHNLRANPRNRFHPTEEPVRTSGTTMYVRTQ
jgi:hypothetical protein